jgi:prepilin-type N-terminal cleavage/methylation domain-containing protein
MTNAENNFRRFRTRCFVVPSSFVIRHSSFRAADAFTLVELLIVMAIILVLAGLILATSSYVQKKGYRSRAEAEIAAMSAALENYKADNGVYPKSADSDSLSARSDLNADGTSGDPKYFAASLFLYGQLSGNNVSQQPVAGMKSYFPFKQQMLGGPRDASGTVNPVKFIRDPFGNIYGYSTSGTGYNPTYDLWSNGDPTPTPASNPSPTPQDKWIKNW